MATIIEFDVKLREMRQADVAAGYALSSEQRWPHRPEDWEFLLQNGQGIVADVDGRVVGTIMSWNFGENVSTLGMVIVSEKWRGRGLGRKLMNAMLELLGDRSVLLNATEDGLHLYESLGFVATATVYQHQSASFSVPMPELIPSERVRPMGARDWDGLGELFSAASSMDRAGLLRSLHTISKGVVLTREHEPVGFALMRRFGRGWSIGPVIAPDTNGAKVLISHWLSRKMGKFCRLDVTENSKLTGWLAELGMPCVGRVTTMVRGEPPMVSERAQVFALVSQALG